MRNSKNPAGGRKRRTRAGFIILTAAAEILKRQNGTILISPEVRAMKRFLPEQI